MSKEFTEETLFISIKFFLSCESKPETGECQANFYLTSTSQRVIKQKQFTDLLIQRG